MHYTTNTTNGEYRWDRERGVLVYTTSYIYDDGETVTPSMTVPEAFLKAFE